MGVLGPKVDNGDSLADRLGSGLGSDAHALPGL